MIRDDACMVPCKVGNVFYADGSCGDVKNYTKGSGKIPVGVVYWIKDQGAHGKVINLKDLGREADNKSFDPTNPYKTAHLYWGYYRYNVPNLKDYGYDNNTLAALQNRDSDLYNGKENTDKILADSGPANCSYGKDTEQYYQSCIPQAAQAARAFYPPVVQPNNQIVGAGHWYLPALGELMELYGYNNSEITKYSGTSGAKSNNKTIINNTLSALKSKSVDAETLTKEWYWSSTEKDTEDSWGLRMSDGFRFDLNKNFNFYYLRVGLEF